MPQWSSLLVATLLLVAPLAACTGTSTPSSTTAATSSGSASSPAATASRLETIKTRGKLICGVEGNIPGFSFVDKDGKYSGLDVEVCRAVAAALFDDPEKIEYVNLDSTTRFEALKSGQVDMLSRNTTWTVSRDTQVGLEFAPTTFYDGQGVMVKQDSGITTLENLKGQSICVESGTTTELNMTDKMREIGLDGQYQLVKFQDANAAYAAYAEGRCQAMTSDKSQLAARRTTLPNPDNHTILEPTLSKEPLGPVTINNDSQWFDAVKWITYSLIQAEEFGITQANLTEQLKTENPEVKRFLGLEGSLGSDMGLPNDFAQRAIKAVGNYGEIYERNLGANSQLKIDRGSNNLWTKGGLMYSPPFR